MGKISRQALWITIGSVPLVLALCLSQQVSRDAPVLESKAKVIWDPPARASLIGYDWFNRTQMICLVKYSNASEFRLADIETHTNRVLHDLTEHLKNSGMALGRGERSIRISPDGRWLLCGEERSSESHFVVLGFYATNVVRTPMPIDDGPACWFNSGLVQFAREQKGVDARILDSFGADSVRTVALPFAIGYPIAFQPQGSCFVTPLTSSNSIQLSRFKLLPSPAFLDSTTLRIPQSDFKESPAFSSDGHKLAWVQRSMQIRMLPKFTSWFPFVGSRKQLIQTLCVADFERKKVQLIGVSADRDVIFGLRWMRDDASVTFIKGSRIYLVKAEI